MKKLITNLILGAGLFLVMNGDGYGQSVLFNQYLANSMFENPALAGAFERPTFSAYYGQHVSDYFGTNNNAESPNYNIVGDNFGFSYQQYSDLFKGGVGISFSGVHYSADGNYSVLNDGLKLSYSPAIKISKKIYLKPGIDIGLYYEKEKYPSYIETIDTYSTEPFITSLVRGTDNRSDFYPDINGGLMLYGKNFHIAVSVNHINNPSTYALNNYLNPDVTNLTYNTVFMNTKTPQRDFITVDLGMNINSKDSAGTWTFSPHYFVQSNGNYYQNYPEFGSNRYNPSINALLGFTYRFKKILVGLDYGLYDMQNSALTPMIGYQNKLFRISYSITKDLEDNNPYPNVRFLNSILLTYMLPAKTKSTPPLFTTIY